MDEMTMDFEAYFRETKAIMAELERADRQIGDRLSGRNLDVLGNPGRFRVQGPAENAWEG